ncbi:hypothetical protein DYBT9275_02980 [Dyadobacter sp. CECT 9275]|uniref:Uncharacterized protein n=1 Tax=Dyadobacter helix TaxID=2822344 RepID=A0A916JE20_9BACT|nr:hypothetical protein [Dyadobacter sp. CECT 9275]CAG5002852.1 hypothetical protein DYBT9275_02980 [Dyadobacter sp. CECT 9275]
MNKKAFNIVISLIILIPVVVFFTAWNYYAINIPKWDDHALKTFIVEYSQATTWQEKFASVFKQHNEHRIALTRAITWLDFRLFGSLNYRHLMLAGNFLLLALIPLWFLLLKNNKKPYFALLPIPFIWLTLAFWENMYWGMSAIQNFGVVTLAVWTLYLCVNPKPWPFTLSLLLALITVATSGNGLLILPIGGVLLFLSQNRKRFALWILMSAGAVFSYFYWYSKNVSNPVSRASVFQLAKGYMAFLGSFAESFPVLDNFKVCVFSGIFLFLVAVSIGSTTLFRIIRNKYSAKSEKATDLFCLGTILFILGTALIVVYSRAGFGLETLITSRYKIYSVLLLITGYLYVVIPIRGSFLSPYISAIILLGVVFNIFSYHYHLVDASSLRKMLTMSQFNWTYTNKSLEVRPDTSFAANIVAKTPVFYSTWPAPIKLADKQGYAGTTNGLPELYAQTQFDISKTGISVKNNKFSSQRLQDSGIYILLSSDKRFYVFPAYRTRNRNRKQLFIKQYYFAPGFHSDIFFAENQIEKGDYKIGLIRQQGDDTSILFKDKTVHIPETISEKIKVNW